MNIRHAYTNINTKEKNKCHKELENAVNVLSGKRLFVR